MDKQRPVVGDQIVDFRGDPWEFRGLDGSGKVIAGELPKTPEGRLRIFYRQVFPECDFGVEQ